MGLTKDAARAIVASVNEAIRQLYSASTILDDSGCYPKLALSLDNAYINLNELYLDDYLIEEAV